MSQISPKQELFCSLHNQNTIQHNRWVKRNTLFSLFPLFFFWTVMHKPVQNKTIYTLIHNTTSSNPSDTFPSTHFPQCQRVVPTSMKKATLAALRTVGMWDSLLSSYSISLLLIILTSSNIQLNNQ